MLPFVCVRFRVCTLRGRACFSLFKLVHTSLCAIVRVSCAFTCVLRVCACVHPSHPHPFGPWQEKLRASNHRRKKTAAHAKNAAVSSPPGTGGRAGGRGRTGSGAGAGAGASDTPARGEEEEEGAGAGAEEGADSAHTTAAATGGTSGAVPPPAAGPASLSDVVVGVLVDAGVVDELPSTYRSLPVSKGDRTTRVVLVPGTSLLPLAPPLA